jgi:probable F420-dependent oxidoreductase
MKIGAIFPQTEVVADALLVRDFAQTIEGLGFHHLMTYEHVLGVNPERPGGWRGIYDYSDPFLEPFVMFSYMAAVTRTLELVTGILVLPQRQTALVAKQAATLDVLCDGRLRLGVGIGWNHVEYEALNENFHNRGRRIEEQVDLLRQLFSEPLVQFEGQWHTIPDAGLNPLPVQRPIPIWFGGHADAVIRRVARMGDGWFPNYRTPADARPNLEKLAGYLDEFGRSPAEVGIECRLYYGDGNLDRLSTAVADWRAAGATHLTLSSMGSSLASPADHLAAFQAFAGAVL